MSGFRSYAVLLLFALIMMLPGCSEPANKQAEPVFRQIPEIREVRPQKSVKIKLRRSVKDDYSWEINGSSADDVVEADRRLRKGLKAE